MLTRKTTMWLFVLLIVVTTATWVEYRYMPSNAFTRIPSTLLPDIEGADTLLLRTATASVRCSKAGGKWEITEPSRQRADANRIDFVLATISRSSLHDRVTLNQRKSRELGLEDYGLVNPRASVVLSGPGGETELRIGGDAPGGNTVFVMTSGSTDIFTADRIVLDILPASAEDFRDRALLPVHASEISGIEIRIPGKGIVQLERTPSGWRMINPMDIRASSPAVSALISSMANSAIEEFVWSPPDSANSKRLLMEEAGAAYGISPGESILSATVKYNDGRDTADLIFGKPAPGAPGRVYVAWTTEHSIGIVGQSILDALKMDADALREHRVFPIRPGDVASISMQSVKGAFAMRLDQKTALWSIFRPAMLPTDQQAAAALVDELLNLEDKSAVQLSESEIQSANTPEAIKLEIITKNQNETVSAYISFVRGANGEAIALDIILPDKKRRHTADVAKQVDGFLGSSWFASARDKTIVAITPASITSISKTSANESCTLMRNSVGEWHSAKPLADNAEAVKTLVSALTSIEATRIETLFTPNTSVYGLSPASVEISVTTDSPEKPVIILMLGDKLPDGSAYVQVKGDDSIFVAPPEAVSALSVPIISATTNNKGQEK